YGRPISVILYTGEVQSMNYEDLTSTMNDGTKTVITTVDTFGNVSERTDPGGTVNYTYHGNGAMKTANFAEQVVETYIDAWGRKEKLIDPSAGTYEYDYNLFGELMQETTPKGTTDYVLDGTGKLEQKTIVGDETDMVLTYSYNADELLSSISSTDSGNGRSYDYSYTYNSYREPIKVTEINPYANFETNTTYDGYGRPLRLTYKGQYTLDGAATDITVRNIYDNDSGMLEEIRNNSDNTRLWRLNAHDARGQVTRTVLGNGFRQNRNYDAYGLPKTVRDVKGSGTSQQRALRLNYSFDAQKGVLDSRRNIDLNWSEGFDYDNLDRLTEITGAVQKAQKYDNEGRITNNTDIGGYNYASDKIYQLASLDLNDIGGAHYQGRERREITYNAFKKPVDIYEENSGRVSFGYSPLMHRSHAWFGGVAEDKEQRRYHKQYSGISPMEIIADTETGNTKILTYIGGDAYSATVVHINQSDPPSGVVGVGYHYVHRDYLGSVMAITNASGAIVEQTQYGAWGVIDKHLRNGDETDFGQDSMLGRGYTGHEHYNEVGLIHMNGRMYDAQLGRFLSPDNYIQDPYNTQNFDRYGYVLNNPLIFSDPSGEFAWAAVIIGAAIGGIVQALRPGANFGSILQGVVIGAVGGYVGAAAGTAVAGAATSTTGFAAGFTSGFAGGFAGAFTGSSLTTWSNGGSFGDGFGNGIGDGFKSGAIAGLFSGFSSGTKSLREGGSFWGETRPAHINSRSIVATGGLDKIPIVESEGNFNDWTGTTPGPDGNTVFRTGRANVTYTYRVSESFIDWDTTLKANAIFIGQDLQVGGDVLMISGYGMTLTGVPPVVGAGGLMFETGGGMALGGSLLESYGSTNLKQGTTAVGGAIFTQGSKVLIRRIPGSALTIRILEQNSALKINLIEKYINGQ
ncbi:hypothetical protein N9954_09215, partial [Maribacter sp.]|nr:hypothetical protein [Maribacter sp.]